MSILSFDNVSYQYPSEDFDIIDRPYETGMINSTFVPEDIMVDLLGG